MKAEYDFSGGVRGKYSDREYVKQLREKMAEKETHVCFLLDESGSMSIICTETISAFNEQMRVVQENAQHGGETKVSLFTWGHHPDGGDRPYERFFEHPVDQLVPLTPETYVPSQTTPMYDAVGLALSKLEPLDKEGDVGFLVLIFSDGLENASVEYNGQQIAALVKKLQDTGRWTFVYIGANQDLAEVQKHLGLVAGNVASFHSTPAGTEQASYAMADSTGDYFSSVRGKGLTSTKSYTGGKTDFSAPEDPDPVPSPTPQSKRSKRSTSNEFWKQRKSS